MHHRHLLLAALAVLAACTTPADVSKPLTASDGDSNVNAEVVDTATGFTVDVKYKRYQMIPETGSVMEACRSATIARANEEAANRGRKIAQINKDNIRVSSGRNGLLGLTSCRAFVEAKWQ